MIYIGGNIVSEFDTSVKAAGGFHAFCNALRTNTNLTLRDHTNCVPDSCFGVDFLLRMSHYFGL